MIKLENLHKVFPGSEVPAVNNLNMQINEGETCVFVGPSGCGKTTTMKMINRLVKPTSGIIKINDSDTTNLNPIELRQNIGYVIQEIGLFPHMTIAENIATVPKEKKWSQSKINSRIDELLNLVGLDPEIYRNRKPDALSGGQRQRVGVARALAADPPILLMDEPFGAVDPITRTHLQNEFIRLQKEINKTIIFVTHDIDEAIKMGDKIAVMREGNLIQYDEPNNLLSSPADSFVESLIGSNRSIKRLNLIKVKDVLNTKLPSINLNTISEITSKQLLDSKAKALPVTDENLRFCGILETKHILNNKENKALESLIKPCSSLVQDEATLGDVLSAMLNTGEKYAVVLNDNQEPKGVLTIAYILELMKDDAA